MSTKGMSGRPASSAHAHKHSSLRPGGPSHQGRSVRMRLAAPARAGWRPPHLRLLPEAAGAARCVAPREAGLALSAALRRTQAGGRRGSQRASCTAPGHCGERPLPHRPLVPGSSVLAAPQPALPPPGGRGVLRSPPARLRSWGRLPVPSAEERCSREWLGPPGR